MSMSNFLAFTLTVVILLSAAFTATVSRLPADELHLYGLEKGNS